MGRLQNMLQSIQDVILVELSSLEQEKYIFDREDFDLEYVDQENEWYAITAIHKKKGHWCMEYDESYEVEFNTIDIGLQCAILDYITSKEESNEMDE